MIGQGVVIGHQYSLGIGQTLKVRKCGTPNTTPQSPITNLAESQVLAYRWNLQQVENETNVNLGTVYSSPDKPE
jgi:hypothetical protein